MWWLAPVWLNIDHQTLTTKSLSNDLLLKLAVTWITVLSTLFINSRAFRPPSHVNPRWQLCIMFEVAIELLAFSGHIPLCPRSYLGSNNPRNLYWVEVLLSNSKAKLKLYTIQRPNSKAKLMAKWLFLQANEWVRCSK